MNMLSHKFNVHTTVHLHNVSPSASAESQAKQAITMVFADSVRDTVIVCIGSSLQTCDPPESKPQLLAGNQNENGFMDGQRHEARLSSVKDVAVTKDGVILFTDWMNNCVREITTDGYVRTLYGPGPMHSKEHGFRDGYGHTALFRRPWGLCLYNEECEIIVVDGLNSSLRHINRATSYVSTMNIQQDMSPSSIDPDQAILPMQLFYPSTIKLGPAGQHVYVTSGSAHAIFQINLNTMLFRAVPWNFSGNDVYRPMCMEITASEKLIVAYVGFNMKKGMSMCDTKIVSYGDLELFCVKREVIYYRLQGKVEVCVCVDFALAVDKQTHDTCVWIADCRKVSCLLRVCLELKWSFLRVLILAMKKPHPGSLFSLLPVCSHNHRIICPLLQHIVKLLQGVCVFG